MAVLTSSCGCQMKSCICYYILKRNLELKILGVFSSTRTEVVLMTHSKILKHTHTHTVVLLFANVYLTNNGILFCGLIGASFCFFNQVSIVLSMKIQSLSITLLSYRSSYSHGFVSIFIQVLVPILTPVISTGTNSLDTGIFSVFTSTYSN